MKLGSLFDGSGGFPLAGAINGIEPVWASEIEPFPIKVTKTRFPRMVHLGDVTKIDGAAIEKVDVITFGSPCQDLSVAGAQKGIHEGARSSLFFEAVRIIKEMRDSDRATGRTDQRIRPRFAVWENVPGAFSSNGGADFQAVLQAFAKIADPGAFIPRSAKWNKPGCIVGDGWSIAWRIMDAQHWGKTVYDRDDGNVLSHGTPQRRRRIYLVADFASERAGEILFEREGVSGDIEQGREARQGTAGDVERGAGGSGGVRCLNSWDVQSHRMYDINGSFHTLYASERAGQQSDGVCFHTQQDPVSSENVAPCIGAQHNATVGIAAFMGGQGAKARGIAYCDDGTAPTLRSAPSGSNTVADVVYSSGGYGSLSEGVGTLGTGSRATAEMICVHPQRTGALCANSHPGSYTGQDAYNDMLPVVKGKPPRKYIVRRLTPLECARLQGFPDWWVGGCENHPITGWWARGGYWTQIIDPRPSVAGFDSAIYKMWGNGIALPCAEFVMRRIVKYA